MFKWIQTIRKADSKARWFYFQYIVYLVVMIATTVYAYAKREAIRNTETREEQAIQHDKA